MRLKRHGTTEPTDRALALSLPPEQNFWRKVDQREQSECWPWTGYRESSGYGIFKRDRTTITAHRLAYEYSKGRIPEGLEIDHQCHIPEECDLGSKCPHRPCCNPAHLKAVTPLENSMRSNAGRRQREKTRCPQGHEMTPENTYAWSGKRACRTCHRDRERLRRNRNRSI